MVTNLLTSHIHHLQKEIPQDAGHKRKQTDNNVQSNIIEQYEQQNNCQSLMFIITSHCEECCGVKHENFDSIQYKNWN